jgi:hypothetical protein
MRDFIRSFNSKSLLVALGLAGVVSGVHATMLDLTPDLRRPRYHKLYYQNCKRILKFNLERSIC